MFNGNKKLGVHVNTILNYVDDIIKAKKLDKSNNMPHTKKHILIGWSRPSQDFIKLNTNGAAHGDPGHTTAWAIFRNVGRRWLNGFFAPPWYL